MDYSKIYASLVEKRKCLPPEGYKEIHHIVPRCLGGNDDESNLVAFTAREHFVAHALLCKIYPVNFKLASALMYMSTDKSGNSVNNRLYSYHRKMFSKANSEFFKNYWKDNPHPMIGRKNPHSEDVKARISASTKKSLEKICIAIHMYALDGTYIKSFSSISEAAKEVKGSASNIKYCADGKFQYAYKFRWSWKDDFVFSSIEKRNVKNNNAGKMWVNNTTTSKLILKSSEIPEGWKPGRLK